MHRFALLFIVAINVSPALAVSTSIPPEVQIAAFQNRLRSPDAGWVYCLSVDGADAPTEVIKFLQAQSPRNLIVGASECQFAPYLDHEESSYKATGKKAHFVFIGHYQPISSNKITIGVGSYADGWKLTLELKNGKWTVVEAYNQFVSQT